MFWMSPSTWARWKSFNHQIFDRGVHNCFFFFFWKPSFSEPSFSIQYQSIISELKGEIGRLKDKVFFNIYIYLFYIISGSVYLSISLYIYIYLVVYLKRNVSSDWLWFRQELCNCDQTADGGTQNTERRARGKLQVRFWFLFTFFFSFYL